MVFMATSMCSDAGRGQQSTRRQNPVNVVTTQFVTNAEYGYSDRAISGLQTVQHWDQVFP